MYYRIPNSGGTYTVSDALLRPELVKSTKALISSVLCGSVPLKLSNGSFLPMPPNTFFNSRTLADEPINNAINKGTFTKAWQGLTAWAAQARKQILGTLTMEGRVCELGATDRYWQELKESPSLILGQKHSATRTFSISDHQNPGRNGLARGRTTAQLQSTLCMDLVVV